MKILILYSGGLDSKIMELYAKINHPNDEIKKVWFDIGQEYSEKEMKCLDSDVDIRKIDYLKDFKCVGKEGNPCGNIMIPGRNAVLALLGSSIYLPDEIWLGALCGETHKEATDKNYEFLENFNTFVNYVLSPYTKKEIKLRFPLADAGFGKLDSVKWALENGLTKEELLLTSSCLSGEKGNCGVCIVCVRRWGIFKQLGIHEKYNNSLFFNKESLIYLKEIITNDYYDKYRKEEIIPALKMQFKTEEINVILQKIELLIKWLPRKENEKCKLFI